MIYIMNYKFLKTFIFAIFVSLNINAADKAPEPVTWNTQVKQLILDDQKIFDGSELIALETPYRALDAAMVPIDIRFKFKQTENKFAKSLTIVVDENPSPIVGTFNFTQKTGDASLSTRIRVDRYTYVRALLEMNDGKIFMVSNYVKAAGGCSAPSLADMDAVIARLGKMKLKFIETGPTGNINKARLIISHPNYSGLQFNQLTRAEIPAHFINVIEVYQDGNLIFSANPDISLSEDPSVTFNYLNSGGPISVKVKDSEGMEFAGDYPLDKILSAK